MTGRVLGLALLLGGAEAAPQPGVEETRSSGREAWFEDVTSTVGLDFTHFNGMTGQLYYPEVVGAGGALFDYDNDGDLDIYLVQGTTLGRGRAAEKPAPEVASLQGRLYQNQLGGEGGRRALRFVDVTAASALKADGYGMGVATGDYDNDGWTDLYLTFYGGNQLWRNGGDGTFSNVTAESGTGDPRWSTSATFLDFDRDGWLDLLVTNYVDFSYATHRVCLTERGDRDYCLPTAFRPLPDRLYRNLRNGAFEDVSERTGLAKELGNGLGVVTGDFNQDGWIDAYVANDLTPNFLWINQRDGKFRNEALVAGCALNADGEAEASMGVEAADLDGDGDEDLFLTHFDRETNTLYLNRGEALFSDATQARGLARTSWNFTSFGTGALDFDNDGWLDLLVVNGRVTFPPGADRARGSFPFDETNQLFRNVGGGRFQDVSAQAGSAFARSEVSRGAALGDVDNDGDTDVLITNNSGPARLLVNRRGQDEAWLGVELRVEKGPRDPLGARIALVLDGGRTLWRRVHTDGSYASAGDPRVLFGLGGGAGAPAEVHVHWPDGSVEGFRKPAVGRYATLQQGRGERLP